MKHIIITLALMLAASTAAFAQKATFTTDGNTYRPTATSVRTSTPDTAATLTPYTYEVAGQKYPIHISKSGSCYIVRVSKRTAKEYRQYLGEDISRDICSKLGRQYTTRKKSSK